MSQHPKGVLFQLEEMGAILCMMAILNASGLELELLVMRADSHWVLVSGSVSLVE